MRQLPTEFATEADRALTICNACRYCEGLCATFQSMTQHRTFTLENLDHLANLCHNCTACYHDCQYTDPHEFAVNVPTALADLRVESYQRYAWPKMFAGLFQRNALAVFIVTALSIALLLGLALVLQERAVLFGEHVGEGAFYKVVSHSIMIAVASVAFGFSVIASLVGVRNYWRSTTAPGASLNAQHAYAALRDVATLRYMDGGQGQGCNVQDDQPTHARRILHQFTMWGFLLCFASTSVATVYDYAFGLIAPYAFLSLPVLLGSVGGLGLVIGPIGLFWLKYKQDPRPFAGGALGMEYAFLASLVSVSITGFMVLLWRETTYMGVFLIVHLGFVLAFFVLLPFSKFVHGMYRLAALLQFHATK